jgi:hypothetical protein
VLIIASFVIIPLAIQLFRKVRASKAATEGQPAEEQFIAKPSLPMHKDQPVVELVLAAFMVLVFAYAFYEMLGFAVDSRLLPSLAIVPGFVFAMIVLVRRLRRPAPEKSSEPFAEPLFLLVLVAYAGLVWAIGFNISTAALLVWMLTFCAGMRIVPALAYGLSIFAGVHGLMILMKLPPPAGALLDII